MDLKVTLDLKDHVGLLVIKETKVTWEREALRVIWDLQVHEEKLVKEETWGRKVNQVTKVAGEIKAPRGRKESKVH